MGAKKVFNLSNVKDYIHRTYKCILGFDYQEHIMRSTQGSSIEIERFVFELTLNSNKLD